jgi:hypothetical protein
MVVVETHGILMVEFVVKISKKRGLKTHLNACRKKKCYTTHINTLFIFIKYHINKY